MKSPKELVGSDADNQCTARLKTCRNKECRFRFKAGDKSWKCPKCGIPRRCTNKASQGYNVCRVHGAGGGRPPIHGKMIVPVQIADAFNRIIGDSSFMSLAMNQALLEARTNQLLEQINEYDTSVAHSEIMSAIFKIENAMLDPDSINSIELARAVGQLKKAVDPVRIEYQLWGEVKDNLELTRRINDTERKYITQLDQLVPLGQVVEAFAIHLRIAMKYIVVTEDRGAFANEMRSLMPRIKK